MHEQNHKALSFICYLLVGARTVTFLGKKKQKQISKNSFGKNKNKYVNNGMVSIPHEFSTYWFFFVILKSIIYVYLT